MNAGRFAILGLAAIFATVGLLPARDDKPAQKALFTVEKHKDIAYRTDKDADKERHKLDVYTPKGEKDFPVVMFVHGGSWTSGNKNMYAALGDSFAKQGIGMVICNYRLSPKVQHPAHIEDVAKAFAWTTEHIGTYGGNPEKLFVCGHSAGGHLVALLATDSTYLKAEKKSPSDIKGVVAISGVYRIAPVGALKGAFGSDEEICRKASPVTHAVGKIPPFLIAYADSDIPLLDVMAKDMNTTLKKADNSCELLECKKRTHMTIITSFVDPTDTLNKAAREFITGKGK